MHTSKIFYLYLENLGQCLYAWDTPLSVYFNVKFRYKFISYIISVPIYIDKHVQ